MGLLKKKTNDKKHARKPVYAAPGLIKSVLKTKELRRALLFTLVILLVYRIGCLIPTPGTNAGQLLQAFSGSSVLMMMNLVGGGSLSNFSIFSLGVTPYITASIIVQMLSMDVIPPLTEMSKSGQKGQIKLNRITKWCGFALALLQAWALVKNFDSQYNLMVNSNWKYYCLVIAIQMGGYACALWFADQITRHGIGNGLSMLIFFGIIVNVPSMIESAYATFLNSATGWDIGRGWLKFGMYILIYIVIILGVILIETSTRRISIRYANQSVGQTGTNSYLPIKVNPASVIPVIFAQSILNVINMIAQLIGTGAYDRVQKVFSLSSIQGIVIYAALVVLCGYIYTDIELDAETMADNLNKNGGYIPNIRPGKDTEKYIHKTSFRIATFGLIALTILAIMPYVLQMATNLSIASTIGGTGIIVAVGVALEIMSGLRSAALPSQKPKLW